MEKKWIFHEEEEREKFIQNLREHGRDALEDEYMAIRKAICSMLIEYTGVDHYSLAFLGMEVHRIDPELGIAIQDLIYIEGEEDSTGGEVLDATLVAYCETVKHVEHPEIYKIKKEYQ